MLTERLQICWQDVNEVDGGVEWEEFEIPEHSPATPTPIATKPAEQQAPQRSSMK